ncbi:uncharacterized protein AB675_43 [Cyphellophora attinorum]|uniref:Chromo domain-containing protein n=1 Tax=Cyphellophora attinorum TaxID=1664694 RepID=A0A0N1NXC8_9EURO|nr:uncharacterized protein AB675_43 [Phialophora attinorum]KPI34683.1 hypothetical protein AB675_43 [Phialophora attinorum]
MTSRPVSSFRIRSGRTRWPPLQLTIADSASLEPFTKLYRRSPYEEISTDLAYRIWKASGKPNSGSKSGKAGDAARPINFVSLFFFFFSSSSTARTKGELSDTIDASHPSSSSATNTAFSLLSFCSIASASTKSALPWTVDAFFSRVGCLDSTENSYQPEAAVTTRGWRRAAERLLRCNPSLYHPRRLHRHKKHAAECHRRVLVLLYLIFHLHFRHPSKCTAPDDRHVLVLLLFHFLPSRPASAGNKNSLSAHYDALRVAITNDDFMGRRGALLDAIGAHFAGNWSRNPPELEIKANGWREAVKNAGLARLLLLDDIVEDSGVFRVGVEEEDEALPSLGDDMELEQEEGEVEEEEAEALPGLGDDIELEQEEEEVEEDEADRSWQIEQITDCRARRVRAGSVWEYQVRWEDTLENGVWKMWDETWEPAANLLGPAADVVEQYHNANPAGPGPALSEGRTKRRDDASRKWRAPFKKGGCELRECMSRCKLQQRLGMQPPAAICIDQTIDRRCSNAAEAEVGSREAVKSTKWSNRATAVRLDAWLLIRRFTASSHYGLRTAKTPALNNADGTEAMNAMEKLCFRLHIERTAKFVVNMTAM